MRIALVLQRFSLIQGGAERSMYELGCCLHEMGADVSLVACDLDTTGINHAPFPIVRLKAAGHWRHWHHAVGLHCAGERYDIVHSTTPLPCADVYQPRAGSILHGRVRHCAAYENTATVLLKRMLGGFNFRRAAEEKAERRLCENPHGAVIAAVSEYVAQQFGTLYGLGDERVRVIHNGVQVEKLRSDDARAKGAKLRQQYDPHRVKTIFVYAAENYHLKGLSWLLRSAARTQQQLSGTDREVLIMVFGKENYEKYYRRVQRLGLSGTVLFMGQTGEMAAVLQMCDAVVLPTYNDACSRMIMEGLAADKPAITTAFNGAAEYLEKGKYGVVIDHCGDVEALSTALLQLHDQQRRERMAAAIHADCLYRRVSMARHARELMALYQDIRSRG